MVTATSEGTAPVTVMGTLNTRLPEMDSIQGMG